MRFNLYKPRRETIFPLLPLLSDAKWSSAGNWRSREQLIRELMRFQIPEAISHLIALLEGDEFILRERAARTLESYHAPQAGPILRKLGRNATGITQNAFAAAIVGCGALTDEEKIS